MQGALDLHLRVGGLAGDGQARVMPPAGGKTLGGLGELQRHHRAPLGDAAKYAPVGAPRLVGADPDRHRHPPPRAAACGPEPWTRGSGSSSADTTRAMPAATMASAQGGVWPWWLHGSKVT